VEQPKTIAELTDRLHQLLCRIEVLEKENAAPKLENANLRARFNMDSSNCSKPLSTDGLTKKPALPKEKKGSRGAQTKHKGSTLTMLETVVLRPLQCDCVCDLSSQPGCLVAERQVFELPMPQLEVTEYQSTEVVCQGCGRKHKANFPEGVHSQTQYGNGVKAFLTLLNVEGKLSFQKTQSTFNNLFGYNVSTIVSANAKFYARLEEVENTIKEKIIASKQAERDIRPVKIKQKIAGCFMTGAEQYARIAGFISTMKKNNLNVFPQLYNLANNNFSFN
jgi:transposase